MKLLVISDVHANLDALNAVWAKEKDCDYILFAGDMVDFGFMPRECIEWFRARKNKLFAVQGNHDVYTMNGQHQPFNPTDAPKNFFEMDQRLLTKEDYDFLGAIPLRNTFTIGDTDFFMEHNPTDLSPRADYAETQLADNQMRGLAKERFAKYFPDAKAPKRCVIFGHSHTQWVASAGPDFTVLNPGSLSYRFKTLEEVRGADYIVIEDGAYRLCHAEVDNTASYDKIDRSGFDEVIKNYARVYFHA